MSEGLSIAASKSVLRRENIQRQGRIEELNAENESLRAQVATVAECNQTVCAYLELLSTDLPEATHRMTERLEAADRWHVVFLAWLIDPSKDTAMVDAAAAYCKAREASDG